MDPSSRSLSPYKLTRISDYPGDDEVVGCRSGKDREEGVEVGSGSGRDSDKENQRGFSSTIDNDNDGDEDGMNPSLKGLRAAKGVPFSDTDLNTQEGLMNIFSVILAFAHIINSYCDCLFECNFIKT